jgi:hypothetical protein
MCDFNRQLWIESMERACLPSGRDDADLVDFHRYFLHSLLIHERAFFECGAKYPEFWNWIFDLKLWVWSVSRRNCSPDMRSIVSISPDMRSIVSISPDMRSIVSISPDMRSIVSISPDMRSIVRISYQLISPPPQAHTSIDLYHRH